MCLLLMSTGIGVARSSLAVWREMHVWLMDCYIDRMNLKIMAGAVRMKTKKRDSISQPVSRYTKATSLFNCDSPRCQARLYNSSPFNHTRAPSSPLPLNRPPQCRHQDLPLQEPTTSCHITHNQPITHSLINPTSTFSPPLPSPKPPKKRKQRNVPCRCYFHSAVSWPTYSVCRSNHCSSLSVSHQHLVCDILYAVKDPGGMGREEEGERG